MISLGRLARGRGSISTAYLMPEFIAAGAGAVHEVSTFTLVVPMPAGVAVGDVVFLQLMSRGPATSGVPLPTSLSDWRVVVQKDLFSTNREQIVFYRIWDGTEPSEVTIVLGAQPNVAVGRSYAWRASGGLVMTGPPTNALFMSDPSAVDCGNDGIHDMPSITPDGPNGLAISFMCFDENGPVGPATGETGADWIEPVDEYGTNTGGNCMIYVNTADLSAGGGTSISGGSTGGGGSTDGVRRSFVFYGTSGLPTFVAAGTGVESGVTATLTAALPVGWAEGDVLAAQFSSRSVDALPTSIAGWQILGTDGLSTAREQYVYLRVATAVETDLSIPVAGVLDVCMARMYAFRNCAGIDGGSIENSQVAGAGGGELVGPDLGPTSQPNSLGVSFVYLDDDDAIDPFSGNTGETWAEAVAEYVTTTGNDGALQCQIVEFPDAGDLVSGGSIPAVTDDGYARSLVFKGAVDT